MAPSSTSLPTFDLGGPVLAAPVIDPAGRRLVGTTDGTLHAVALQNATSFAWPGPAPIEAAVGVSPKGRLFVPGTDGVLRALSPEGDEVWSFDLASEQPTISAWGQRAWRARPVVGHSLVVAGNDDFHVYAFTLGGDLRWAAPTGFAVRGPASFAEDGTVVVGSLDMAVYALAPTDGRPRWRKPVGNLVTGRVGVADGLAVVATAGGQVLGLDLDGGTVRFTRTVGSPVLGGVTAMHDGWVLATSDGRLLHLGPRGEVRWTAYLEAPAFAVPTVGAPPDGSTLVLVGTADGKLHGVTEEGQRAWVMDPLEQADGEVGTAGHALGEVAADGLGAAVATRGGQLLDVQWGSERSDGVHFTLDPSADGPDGPQLRLSTGALRTHPLPDDGVLHAEPGHVVSLAASARGAQPGPATVDPQVRTQSDWIHRVRTSADLGWVHLEPVEPSVGAHALQLEYAAHADGGRTEAAQSLRIAVPERADPPAEARLTLRDLTLDAPAIAHAIDPLGLARLCIDVAVLEEGEDGTGVAWGVQRGSGERTAFRTTRRHGALVLEATTSRVGTTWASLSLERVRLAVAGAAPRTASVLMEGAALPSPTRGVSQALQFPTAALERAGKPFLAARELWTHLAGQLPDRPSLSHLAGLGQSAPRTLGMLPRLLDAEVWGPWGMLDAHRRLLAVGRMAVSEHPASTRPEVVVDHVTADAVRRTVTAQVGGGEAALRDTILSIVLLEMPREGETCGPVPETIDYTARTVVRRNDDGLPYEVVLEIPLTTPMNRPMEAWVLADLDVVWRGPLTG